jgi:anti-sigma regulatory factor (Ser/Thr protein kinase)
VRDFGRGLAAAGAGERARPGLGMPLMEALSSAVEISSEPGRGTEVLLRFDLPGRGEQGEPPAPPRLLTALTA